MNDQQLTRYILNRCNNNHNKWRYDNTTFDKKNRVDNHSGTNHTVCYTDDGLA